MSGTAEPVLRTTYASAIARCSALLLICLGVIVLVGWYTHTRALVQLLPQLPPMTRSAAASFLLCGVALLVLASRGPRLAIVLCAGTVGGVASLNVVEIAFGVHTGVNELLGAPYIGVRQVKPGRMAPLTAISFTLASVGLLISTTRLPKRAAVLGIVGAMIAAGGLAGIIGFFGNIALAALHTAVGLAVLGFGLLALAWSVERGDRHTAPSWLPVLAALAVAAGIVGLWRALVLAGHPAFALLPMVVLAGGCLLGPLFGLAIHLSQRAQAQAAALRRSDAFLQQAQQLSRTGSFAWSIRTAEIMCSQQLYRIFELDPNAPITLDLIIKRLHPDDAVAFRALLGHAREDGRDFECEHRLQLPDGSHKYVHLTAHGTRDVRTGLEYVGAVQDVTQRRLSEEALGKARLDLARVARVTSHAALTASIAHEVNQPLSALTMNASTCLRMLATEPPKLERARELARRTIDDSNRASAVITRLRALFANQEPANEFLDLNDATREVIALLRSELQSARVILRMELADELPRILGDRVQLQQVITNLVRNACDAMNVVNDRPRELFIRTGPDESDCVRLTVQDAGVGFDAATADRLFQAFYTTKPDGMGMGLSISRSIIDSHHGRLWAAGNDGPGAQFSFSLPAVRDAAAASRSSWS